LRARLLELRQRGAQALVGGSGLRLELVQLLVAEHDPPLPARRRVRRGRRLPLPGLLVAVGGRGRARALAVRGERAGAHRNEGDDRQRVAHHDLLPALAACALPGWGGAIRTWAPSLIESGGLATRVSSALTPESTSTSVPKSRPCVMVLRCTRCSASTTAT